MKFSILISAIAFLSGCAGMKVVNPANENKDANTKMVDWSGGSPKIVATHSCKLEATGNKFSAIGKTEEDARKEVVAKCRDHSVVSFCNADKVTCVKN